MEIVQGAAILTNLAIALAYLGIGLYIAPSFQIAYGQYGAQLARAAGLLFFITCAATHTELAWHALTDPIQVGSWFTSWHGLIIHTVQAVAGWTFCFLGIRFLNIKITTTDDKTV